MHNKDPTLQSSGSLCMHVHMPLASQISWAFLHDNNSKEMEDPIINPSIPSYIFVRLRFFVFLIKTH